MSISKKTRDIALQIIIDHQSEKSGSHVIGPHYLETHGLPSGDDPMQVIEVLRSMGLVSYEKDVTGEVFNIKATDAGLHFFETEADEKAKTKKVFRHEWMIAAFSAIVGAILSRPLWNFIEFIVGLFQRHEPPL